MRTYVATYKIHTDYKIDKFFDVISTSDIKYKFAESKVDNSTVCYLTLIAKNRLHLRKLKKESLKTLKHFGKVKLIIGVG